MRCASASVSHGVASAIAEMCIHCVCMVIVGRRVGRGLVEISSFVHNECRSNYSHGWLVSIRSFDARLMHVNRIVRTADECRSDRLQGWWVSIGSVARLMSVDRIVRTVDECRSNRSYGWWVSIESFVRLMSVDRIVRTADECQSDRSHGRWVSIESFARLMSVDRIVRTADKCRSNRSHGCWVSIKSLPLNKSLGEYPNRILFEKRSREQKVFYILVRGGTYESCTPK